MSYIVKFLLPFFKKHLLKELSKSENRTFVVAKMNQYIDLPNMSEEAERELIEKIYDSLSLLLKAYMRIND